MKKVLVALMMVVLLVSLCACSVASGSFMSRAQANSLAKNFDGAQAQVTFKYTAGSDKIEITVTYNLLFDKAPIAATRFVQLAQGGKYENTVVDTLDTSYKYVVMGRYMVEENKYYDVTTDNVSFAGEFKQNGYRQPKDGYAEFGMYSLAMYHAMGAEYFDAANGTLILALSAETLNSDNYAVFAEFDSMTVSVQNGRTRTYNTPNSQLHDSLMSFTTRSTGTTIYDSNSSSSVTASVMSTKVYLSVQILGDYDFSKLPTIR